MNTYMIITACSITFNHMKLLLYFREFESMFIFGVNTVISQFELQCLPVDFSKFTLK